MAYVKIDKELDTSLKKDLTTINNDIASKFDTIVSTSSGMAVNLKSEKIIKYKEVPVEEGSEETKTIVVYNYTRNARAYNTAADAIELRAAEIKKKVTKDISSVIKALNKVETKIDGFEVQDNFSKPLTFESVLENYVGYDFSFLSKYGSSNGELSFGESLDGAISSENETDEDSKNDWYGEQNAGSGSSQDGNDDKVDSIEGMNGGTSSGASSLDNDKKDDSSTKDNIGNSDGGILDKDNSNDEGSLKEPIISTIVSGTVSMGAMNSVVSNSSSRPTLNSSVSNETDKNKKEDIVESEKNDTIVSGNTDVNKENMNQDLGDNSEIGDISDGHMNIIDKVDDTNNKDIEDSESNTLDSTNGFIGSEVFAPNTGDSSINSFGNSHHVSDTPKIEVVDSNASIESNKVDIGLGAASVGVTMAAGGLAEKADDVTKKFGTHASKASSEEEKKYGKGNVYLGTAAKKEKEEDEESKEKKERVKAVGVTLGSVLLSFVLKALNIISTFWWLLLLLLIITLYAGYRYLKKKEKEKKKRLEEAIQSESTTSEVITDEINNEDNNKDLD